MCVFERVKREEKEIKLKTVVTLVPYYKSRVTVFTMHGHELGSCQFFQFRVHSSFHIRKANLSNVTLEKKVATQNSLEKNRFINVTNHCTSLGWQVARGMVAAASSALRLVCDEGSSNAGGLENAHSPCCLFRVLQMRHGHIMVLG